MNRRLTSAIATFHFAPTTNARARLLAEHIEPDTVVVTGNTVIDALRHLRSAMRQPAGVTLPPRSRLILLTCHRRENHGDKLGEICGAVREIVAARAEVIVVCPVHPHPNVASRMRSELGGIRGIQLLEPVDYPELLWLMEASAIVLTDSGGLQEEAPAFKRPVTGSARGDRAPGRRGERRRPIAGDRPRHDRPRDVAVARRPTRVLANGKWGEPLRRRSCSHTNSWLAARAPARAQRRCGSPGVLMKAVDRCPACDGRLFHPFSFTVESERNGAVHFAQTRCRLAFFLMHYTDEWTGRGGRLPVWCRKPPEQVPAAS